MMAAGICNTEEDLISETEAEGGNGDVSGVGEVMDKEGGN
jgi:hypothetical protein